jgi:hypothetical protein
MSAPVAKKIAISILSFFDKYLISTELDWNFFFQRLKLFVAEFLSPIYTCVCEVCRRFLMVFRMSNLSRQSIKFFETNFDV